jgi:peptide deformylase
MLSASGEPIHIDAEGWYARILQHEIDHLGGRLYIDRMLSRTFMSESNFGRQWRDVPVSEVCAALGVEMPE